MEHRLNKPAKILLNLTPSHFSRKVYRGKSQIQGLMEYAFKRGFKPDLERIIGILQEEFPGQVRREEDKITMAYGSIGSATIWLEGKKMMVLTESQTGVSDEVILDTNRRFRKFLERATGYTAKQRMQMAKKEIQGTD